MPVSMKNIENAKNCLNDWYRNYYYTYDQTKKYENEDANELNEENVKSLAIVPMHNNAYVVGVIVIENYKEKQNL